MEALTQVQPKKSKKKKNQQKTFKPIDPSFSEFKKAEKKFRIYKDFITDFSGILSFNENFDISQLPIEKKVISGLTVYKFNEPQGAYLIKNFMDIPEQILITMKCINEYNKKPYRTNLFIYETDSKQPSKDENDKKNEELSNMEEFKIEPAPQKVTSQDQAKEEENSYITDQPGYNKERFLVCDPSLYCFDRKIRWSNVGYQYDWNNRTYPSEKTQLPKDLLNLAKKTKDFLKEELPEVSDYQAESTIINYYDQKNFMGGHLDDGELDQKSPIFSYNFGLSCVFLMGGRTKDVKPWPIQLDSGDLFIMSGYSRMCYHGVPRILEGSFDYKKFSEYCRMNYPVSWSQVADSKPETLKSDFENNEVHAINYLRDNRLNLNFRQVFSS